ncbi:cell division control protein 42 homolog [Babylonia areolata]|uniref:cell division control protein 42 homolog n=1 Tax=Babylonia areolata TaxID=304850 RepID=UPI003FD129AE
MGHLSQSGKSEYKCVIVGDGGVGKTSMLIRYVNDDFLTEYMPTCFDSYSVPMDLGDRQGTLVLVDTAGQETYDRLRTLSYYNTDIFVVCFSVASHDSFLNVRSRWVPELHDYRPGTPFLLVGTQADLRQDSKAPSKDMVSAQKGKKLARKVGAVGYLECSALTGSGLDRVFRQTVTCAVRPQKKRKLWSSFKHLFVKR